jgi:L-ascorbate metabolism protein UlaG (beta-lactamase superfamily)
MNRRKWLAAFAGTSLASFYAYNQYAAMQPQNLSYDYNPKLPIIKDGWQGNPLVGKQFVMQPLTLPKSFADILRWQMSANPQKAEKKAEDATIKNVASPDIFTSKQDALVWLGHSSFLIRLNGITLLTDPVYQSIPFTRQLNKPPFKADEIRNIDYLLLSHDHRDHFDEATLATILANNPQTEVLMPLRMENLLLTTYKKAKFQSAGWYQTFAIKDNALRITYLPAKHWCRRGLTDTNQILWGSFMIQSQDKNIYFAADTGYHSHFAEIATLFPTIDIALMPIGAYKPDYIMKEVHTTPSEAVQGFNDLKAKLFIPMHYGTFDLSDEPATEPPKLLQSLYEQKKIQGKLKMLNLGETLALS